MVAFFLIVAGLCLVMFSVGAFFFLIMEKEYKNALLTAVFIVCGLVLMRIPFINNTKSWVATHSIIANTVNDVTFDSQMVIQWDEYEGDNWWTWNSLEITKSDKFNIRVRKATPADL